MRFKRTPEDEDIFPEKKYSPKKNYQKNIVNKKEFEARLGREI